MVGQPGKTPVKLPFELLTDQLTRLQQDVQALSTLQGTLQQIGSLVVRATLGLVGGMLLCTAILVWWTAPPATPNYTPVFGALDTVLVDAWKSLPKDLQGKLELAYRAGQVRPPTDRDKK